MRQIITEANDKFIMPNKLKGKEFVAYSTKTEKTGTSTYCILSRLENCFIANVSDVDIERARFGFINPFRTNVLPSFVGSSFGESIMLASKKRTLCVFETPEEMLIAITNKTF